MSRRLLSSITPYTPSEARFQTSALMPRLSTLLGFVPKTRNHENRVTKRLLSTLKKAPFGLSFQCVFVVKKTQLFNEEPASFPFHREADRQAIVARNSYRQVWHRVIGRNVGVTVVGWIGQKVERYYIITTDNKQSADHLATLGEFASKSTKAVLGYWHRNFRFELCRVLY